ncbi:hypothetical protein C1H46_001779 [Malus baccata]|uniref:Integrase catalytic domain-containing protein n=1 Tax=Malus baccata TaxID=106549 RepID=A0A540NNE5_MALBA|nr:hypothetical protein C1H46_001779 [Malus baccata]
MKCYHQDNFSYQGRPPPSSITAMHANYQPSAPQEQFWVADTGATSHMTSDLSNLNFATPFTGTESITTANGSGLQISHTSLWHNMLGHPSNTVVSQMLHESQVPFSMDHSKHVCISYLQGKFTKLSFSYPANKIVKPLGIIHNDVWGPSPTLSIEGFKYYVLFIDECTRLTWIFPLMNKSEVFHSFVQFHSFIETQFSTAIKVFQSDGGGEYTSNQFKHFLLDKGILHHKSCPHTPEQNGLA